MSLSIEKDAPNDHGRKSYVCGADKSMKGASGDVTLIV
jgi:hypothetical protein